MQFRSQLREVGAHVGSTEILNQKSCYNCSYLLSKRIPLIYPNQRNALTQQL